ncbi:MAG: hypothetical protein R3B70_13585 [Polyangiaceae bacterium]
MGVLTFGAGEVGAGAGVAAGGEVGAGAGVATGGEVGAGDAGAESGSGSGSESGSDGTFAVEGDAGRGLVGDLAVSQGGCAEERAAQERRDMKSHEAAI